MTQSVSEYYHFILNLLSLGISEFLDHVSEMIWRNQILDDNQQMEIFAVSTPGEDSLLCDSAFYFKIFIWTLTWTHL